MQKKHFILLSVLCLSYCVTPYAQDNKQALSALRSQGLGRYFTYHDYHGDSVLFSSPHAIEVAFGNFKPEPIPSQNVVINRGESPGGTSMNKLSIRTFDNARKKQLNSYIMLEENNGHVIAKRTTSRKNQIHFNLDSLQFPLKISVGNGMVKRVNFILYSKSNLDLSIFLNRVSGATFRSSTTSDENATARQALN